MTSSRRCANRGKRRRAPPGRCPQKSTHVWGRSIAIAAVILLLLSVVLWLPPISERLQVAFFTRGQKHIAVLPFDNIGNNPENEAMVEGVVDSLSGKLSNLELGKQSLWVIPSSEVRRLKVTDPAAALRELGATLVVKGDDIARGLGCSSQYGPDRHQEPAANRFG